MRNLLPCLAALVLTLGVPPLASARIGGGKNALTDCYAEWDGVTATSSAKPTVVDCTDGDPTCDTDGVVDGKCTFTPSLCVFQQDITGCTPVAITKLTVPKVLTKVGKNVLVPLGTPPSLIAPSCGNSAEIVVSTPKKGTGARTWPAPSSPISVVAKTDAAGKLKTDKNHLVFKCRKATVPTSCPENPAGGPNKFTFEISDPGDLDNGNSGNSFSNPNVVGTVLNVCLKDCNTASSPACTEDEAATNGVNGATFGAPLPLIAANVPVCVVNRYSTTTKVSGGNIDFNTGQMSMTVNLLSDVVLTQSPNLCPVCSGQNLGDKGKCDGTSSHAGLDCTVDGIITVGSLNKRFTLSSQCPPKGVVSGTLTIPLAFTTGTSTLAGPKPCGESTDDQCGNNGPCNATGDTNDNTHPHCAGATTCASIDSTGHCLDSRGGISQNCCAGNPNLGCQPTSGASGIGSIVRQGAFTVPTPAVPDPTFPKCATATLGAVFCESTTSSNLVNTTTGLPGPGAILLPVKWNVKLSSTTSDCP